MKAKTDISPSLKVHSSKCLKLTFSLLFTEKPSKDYKKKTALLFTEIVGRSIQSQ